MTMGTIDDASHQHMSAVVGATASRDRNNSTEKTIMMCDQGGEEYSAVNPFETNADGEIALHYHKIGGLQEKHLEALKKMDIDGNGTVSLSEMLTMEKSNRSLKQTVCYLAIALFFLIGTLFAVSWAAAVLAQQTDVDHHAMTAKGTSNIVSTAEAKESVPAAFASLLSREQLGRVKELTLVKLVEIVQTENSTLNITNATEAAMLAEIEGLGGESDGGLTTVGCPTCPKTLVTQVKAVQHYNDTYIEFICEAGITVAMDHGEIHIFNLPHHPASARFTACGSAACSSISLDGADLPAMKEKASQLGFVDSAGARRGSRRGRSCATMKASCMGTGFCKSFGGCYTSGGGIGDKTYFTTTNSSVPLTVQMRLSGWGPAASWASRFATQLKVNGRTDKYMNFVDGCAIRYGQTTVSATFDGMWPWKLFGRQTPVGYINGSPMRSGSQTITNVDALGRRYQMNVNYGRRHLYVQVKDASGKQVAKLQCRKFMLLLEVDGELNGKGAGIAGTGDARSDFASVGPSPTIAPDTQGAPISTLNGQCSRFNPMALTKNSRNPLRVFNGNANDSPLTKWQDTWMVDADSSLFTYKAPYEEGWWMKFRSGVN
jgi:hypothetical protein